MTNNKHFIIFGFILGLFVTCLSINLHAFDVNNAVNGGYLAANFQYTPIKNATGVMLGVEGDWVINRTFSLGAYGYNLLSRISAATFSPASSGMLDFEQYGLKLGYIFYTADPWQTDFNLLFGIGHVGYSGTTFTDSSNLFVLTPQLNLTYQLVSFCKIAIGVGYRFVSGVKTAGLTNNDLSNYFVNLGLQFGGNF